MKKNNTKLKETFDVLNPLVDAKESVSTTFKLVISALALVSALAWNEAIKGIFDLLKQNELFKNAGFAAPFIYAILVTLFTIFIINRIQKFEKKLKDKKEIKKISKVGV